MLMSSNQASDLTNLSDLMDTRFRGPFGWRFGWDGLLGLVPVVGDVVTNCVSVYIVFRAAQLGCPPSVLLRMGINILIENLVDIIPFFGNLFDFLWKANTKNLKLVDQYLANPTRAQNRSRLFVTTSLALIVMVVVACLVLTVLALKFFIGLFDNLAN